MDSLIELHIDGQWVPAASISVAGNAVRFEYLPEYVFGSDAPPPVALGLPVSMDIVRGRDGAAPTPLAFLWDLVPQGRGRQHVANLLDLADQDPANDLPLAQHGAFAPVGRMRLDTAVRFYEQQAGGLDADGFSMEDMVERTDAFLDQLALHGMLSAGTPGVQGVAPKFLLTQDAQGRWFPDVALSDERARAHWIVKLPRGRTEADRRILRHEAIYLEAARQLGLQSLQGVFHRTDMLFLPRFDRVVHDRGVERVHQESLAALLGLTGFGRSASLFDLTKKIAEVATDPAGTVAEFMLRDAVNRALRNPDNHLRNTALQLHVDGTVRLSPVYDLAPMYMDPELVTRTCHWSLPDRAIVGTWNEILARLDIDDTLKDSVATSLAGFAERLHGLPDRLRALDADADVIEACRTATQHELANLAGVS